LVAGTMLLVTDPLNVSGRDLGLLFLLGGLVMPISLGLITIGPRYLPAPEVGLVMLLETVLGPLWVWLACAEIPHAGTFVGGAIVVCILVGHSLLGMRTSHADTSMTVPPGMSPRQPCH